jgi:hypothetical protein
MHRERLRRDGPVVGYSPILELFDGTANGDHARQYGLGVDGAEEGEGGPEGAVVRAGDAQDGQGCEGGVIDDCLELDCRFS